MHLSGFGSGYRVRRHSFLNRAEEFVLFKRWKEKGCMRSRDRIIESNMMFIIGVAAKYRKKYSHVDMEDLVGYGTLGFIKGLLKTDINYIKGNNKISSYVVFWVKQSIQRNAEDNESGIRLPANHHESIRKKVEDGIDLNDEEKAWMDNVRGVNKTDDTIGDDDSKMTVAEKYSFVNHDESELVDNMLIAKERDEIIESALSGLEDQDKQIMIHLFGLGGAKEMNLREVGDVLGVSHEQVRKRRMEILPALHKKIRKKGIHSV